MADVKSQQWFEMADLRRRRLATSVWIPLRISETLLSDGKIGRPGSVEEVYCAGSIAFPISKKDEAEKLGWHDLGLLHSGGPYAFKDKPYKPAEVYQYHDGVDLGVDLVFEQTFSDHEHIWHVNQDLVLALRLRQEGDVWIRPEEGYVEVMRQRRDQNGRVIAIEIKSEYLRDYLAARGLALRVGIYRQRVAVVPEKPTFGWPENPLHDNQPHDRFEARINEVDESGGPYGAGVAIFQAWRTDVDNDEDVPVFGQESDSNTDGRSVTFKREGTKHYRIEGELWREEWIEPTEKSERVRGDNSSEQVSFTVDAEGKKETSAVLDNEDIGRYLWFSPDVIPSLLSRRGSGLRWHTAHTGSVWCSPSCPVHFGINRLGLINVYAYDVAKYPIWQQKIWAAHNVAPNGAVSSELLDAQMRTKPASTKAPEQLLPRIMDALDGLFVKLSSTPLFKSHHATDEILRAAHRFRSLNRTGLLALAKDLARIISDRIELSALQKVAMPPTNEKWGTLKNLEKALATKISADDAHKVMAPLFGIYELRLGDAHLPTKDIESALVKAGVNLQDNNIEQGRQLIESAVGALSYIYQILSK